MISHKYMNTKYGDYIQKILRNIFILSDVGSVGEYSTSVRIAVDECAPSPLIQLASTLCMARPRHRSCQCRWLRPFDGPPLWGKAGS